VADKNFSFQKVGLKNDTIVSLLTLSNKNNELGTRDSGIVSREGNQVSKDGGYTARKDRGLQQAKIVPGFIPKDRMAGFELDEPVMQTG